MWYIVVFIIAYAIAIAMTPGPVTPKPPVLSDISVPTAEPGRPIPVVFGTYVIKSPNVVWYGDLGYKKVKTKSGK